jgi:hypothetical protein
MDHVGWLCAVAVVAHIGGRFDLERSDILHTLLRVGVLRQEGVIVAPQQISSPMEQWLARYDQYLNQVGGKAAATRKKYLSYARRFWQFRFGSVEAKWSSLRAEDLVGFVQQEAAPSATQLRRTSCYSVTSDVALPR